MRSMVCRASSRFFCTPPVSGSGASPRCISAEWLSDRTNVVNSTGGRLSSTAASSPSVVASAEGRLRDVDDLGLVGRVGERGEVLLDVLLVEDALADVALADAHVPLPRIDGLGVAGRHGASVSLVVACSRPRSLS